MLRTRLAAAVAVGTLIASLFAASPATAAAGADPALQPCIDLAVDTGIREWVCTGEGLFQSRDAKGKKSEKFTEVAPIAVESELDPSKLDATAKGGDFYDTWCEYGTVCHREISSYIEETKGNAAYGNQDGAIGAYDAVVRTNINGRSARWTVTLIWDYGPTLKFENPDMLCWEDKLVDGPCGVHDVSTGPVTISSASFRWQSSLIQGNYLRNNNPYYAQLATQFTPTGYPKYSALRLKTAIFNCYPVATTCVF